MPSALENETLRRRDGACANAAAKLPAPASDAPGNGRRAHVGPSGFAKKMAPERSAVQNLPVSRSGARWQGQRGELPPGPRALHRESARGSFGGLARRRLCALRGQADLKKFDRGHSSFRSTLNIASKVNARIATTGEDTRQRARRSPDAHRKG